MVECAGDRPMVFLEMMKMPNGAPEKQRAFRTLVIWHRGKNECLVCTGAQARIESVQGVHLVQDQYSERVIWHRGKK